MYFERLDSLDDASYEKSARCELNGFVDLVH